MSYTPFTVVIPARMNSTRLPMKPTQNINGRPMIAHTIDRAKESGAEKVIVVTDHPVIGRIAADEGVMVKLTPSECVSGTDRIALAISELGIPKSTVIVNLQGDEPMFPGEHLAELAQLLKVSGTEMATVAVSDLTATELDDPNVVKVVGDRTGNALYFSRAGVPFSRDGQLIYDHTMRAYFMRHVGVYAYHAGFLLDFIKWGISPLEYTEKLEQLRVLWNGGRIRIHRLNELSAHGVDTMDDLLKVRDLMK
jgi:3-deoxy-manno-octulosonate cytidylyltransferase (CMP-KDO synthetase)